MKLKNKYIDYLINLFLPIMIGFGIMCLSILSLLNDSIKKPKKEKTLSGNWFILEQQPKTNKYQFTMILESGNLHQEIILTEDDIQKIYKIFSKNIEAINE